MMCRGHLALGLLLGTAACGQALTPPEPTMPAPSGFTVGGRVLDLMGQPVVDLFVTVSTEFCIPDRTDANGHFEIQRVQSGPKRLITYGETTTGTAVASVAIALEAQSAQELGQAIELPVLDESCAIELHTEMVQTIESREGLSIDIQPEALTLAPFAVARLQVARVPLAQAPAIAPASLQLVDLFVLHPILSTLNPPSPLRFPNDLGLR